MRPPRQHCSPARIGGSPESEAGEAGPERTLLRSDRQGPPGPIGALFDTTLFQYKQSRKKVMSLWGRGMWEEWFVLLRRPTHIPQVGQAGRARWHSAWPSHSHKWGAQAPPKPRMTQSSLWSLPLSLMSYAFLASTPLTASGVGHGPMRPTMITKRGKRVRDGSGWHRWTEPPKRRCSPQSNDCRKGH